MLKGRVSERRRGECASVGAACKGRVTRRRVTDYLAPVGAEPHTKPEQSPSGERLPTRRARRRCDNQQKSEAGSLVANSQPHLPAKKGDHHANISFDPRDTTAPSLSPGHPSPPKHPLEALSSRSHIPGALIFFSPPRSGRVERAPHPQQSGHDSVGVRRPIPHPQAFHEADPRRPQGAPNRLCRR